MTGWVAAVMVGAAALLFVVVYVQTGASLEHQIDIDLRGDVAQILQAVRTQAVSGSAANGATGSALRRVDGSAVIRTRADRYLLAQRYTATSTLLFILIPGASPATNHPEVFGRQEGETGETASEQAAEDQESRRLDRPALGYSIRRVPDVGEMRLLERSGQVGGLDVIAGAAEPLAGVRAAQHSVARAFVLAGGLGLVLALLASYLAGARVTAPLRRLAGIAARVNAGDLDPRMPVTSGRGDEVSFLAETFNHMLDRLASAFQTQREFMADASHELRTPLTVIRGQLEVLAATEHPSRDEVRRVERVVQAEVTRMSRLVDDLLLLAAAEQSDFLRVEAIDLQPFVVELWDGVTLIADRRFELGPVPDGILQADPDRVAQAVRNLARNAIEHTTAVEGLVRLEVAARRPGSITFAVVDDGPGIPPEERERVFERLHRTDSSRARVAGGAGLGLAIVRAIADAHRGEVAASAGPGGVGARVELVLPGFRATSSNVLPADGAVAAESGYTD